MKHALRVKLYLRYGDDFVIFTDNREQAEQYRELMKTFLREKLSLALHTRNDVIFPCRQGIKFLGCMIYPYKCRLLRRVWHRVLERTAIQNVSSYSGLVHAHGNAEAVKHFHWSTLKFLDE